MVFKVLCFALLAFAVVQAVPVPQDAPASQVAVEDPFLKMQAELVTIIPTDASETFGTRMAGAIRGSTRNTVATAKRATGKAVNYVSKAANALTDRVVNSTKKITNVIKDLFSKE